MLKSATSLLKNKMTQQYADKQPRGFRNHVQNIAIVGAGGSIGQHITQALLEAGKHKVTAITREDSSNKLPEGIHNIAKVNYDSHESLVAAMKGQDALIITMKVMAPADSQFKLMDAAIDAGVEYIMDNEYGVDANDKSLGEETMVGPACHGAREHVEKVAKEKGKDTHWLALSCGFWYEFSLAGKEARYGFDFDKKALTWIDDGKQKVTMSTWPQTGRAVASLFALPKVPENASDSSPTLSQFVDKPVYVSSFNVDQRDMLDSVLRVTGDKESDWTFTQETSQERYKRALDLRKQGQVEGHILTLYSRVFFPNGGGDFQHKVENKALGLPKEDLDEYTKIAIQMHKDGYFEARYG